VRVISLDGGGLRAVMEAVILERLLDTFPGTFSLLTLCAEVKPHTPHTLFSAGQQICLSERTCLRASLAEAWSPQAWSVVGHRPSSAGSSTSSRPASSTQRLALPFSLSCHRQIIACHAASGC
jgi:hypothetical protein